MLNAGEAHPRSKNAHLQGRAREVGGEEVGGMVVEWGAGRVAEGFGTLVRVERGWGGEEDVERLLVSTSSI